MGGQKFVDAALALEGELDDEKVFELIAGEWVEAKEAEEAPWRGLSWLYAFMIYI